MTRRSVDIADEIASQALAKMIAASDSKVSLRNCGARLNFYRGTRPQCAHPRFPSKFVGSLLGYRLPLMPAGTPIKAVVCAPFGSAFSSRFAGDDETWEVTEV